MRNNGFTLIELLAVIVILAIIALIATPIVLGIIEDSKKSAFLQTGNGIVDAAEYYYMQNMLDGEKIIEDTIINFPDVGQLEFQGEIPKKGSVIINPEGQIALGIADDRYCIIKGFADNDLIITEGTEKCLPPVLSYLATINDDVTEVDECVNNKTEGACEAGTPFAVRVNSNVIYNFHVIADNGKKVTLIMDRNLGEGSAWVTKEDYNDDDDFGDYGNNDKGPITALKYLNVQTSNWSNITAIENYTYENTRKTGYKKLEIANGTATLINRAGTEKNVVVGISRARMLTLEEMENFVLNSESGTDVPSYLITNISDGGYWFLNSSGNQLVAGIINHAFDYYDALNVRTTYGVRPVIELYK